MHVGPLCKRNSQSILIMEFSARGTCMQLWGGCPWATALDASSLMVIMPKLRIRDPHMEAALVRRQIKTASHCLRDQEVR